MITPECLLPKLFRLKRGITPFGLAPHKPVLLITLLELLDKGAGNCFPLDIDLVGLFRENWLLLVETPHQPDVTQPYYHLQNDLADGEPLWQLYAKPGYQIPGPIKSVRLLAQAVSHGALHPVLFSYLTSAENRENLRQQLLYHYFPAKVPAFQLAKHNGVNFFQELEAWVLNAPEAKTKILRTDQEEVVFVRNGLFRRLVPQIYQHTCCISGMRLHSTFNHQYIDACHIVPFAVSQDDRVTNGLSLCPNLHRAFDRGLVGIDADYRVILSAHIREDERHAYSLTQLSGKRILLPVLRHAWPDPEQLRWHRENQFMR